MTVPNFNVVSANAFAYAAIVTPVDSGPQVGLVDANGVSRTASALWIGGAGNVAIVDAAGGTTLFSGVAAGTLLPIRCQRVNATNTSATLIVALF